MIVGLLGKPGSGKSYEATRLALEAVRSGRRVITNLPLKVAGWNAAEWALITVVPMWTTAEHENPEWEVWSRKYRLGGLVGAVREKKVREVEADLVAGQKEPERRITSELRWWSRGSDWTEAIQGEGNKEEIDGKAVGPLLLVDEVGQAFDKASAADRIVIKAVLAEHRHSLADVYLIAQSHDRLPLPLKHICEEWIELAGLRGLGFRNGYNWNVYQKWYGARDSLRGGMRRYDKAVFERYESHALGTGSGTDGNEVSTEYRQRAWWLRMPVLMMVLGLGVVLYLVAANWALLQGLGSGRVIGQSGLGGFSGAAVEKAGGATQSATSMSAGAGARRPRAASRSRRYPADGAVFRWASASEGRIVLGNGRLIRVGGDASLLVQGCSAWLVMGEEVREYRCR